MSAERGLVDTNVLIYAFDPGFEHHEPCRRLFDDAKPGKSELCFVPQVLIEFYAVVTNPRRVHTPRSGDEALGAIRFLLALPGTVLLPNPADLVERWIGLLERHPVTGRRVFDVQLVAAMLGNNIQTLYTFNTSDFEAFDECDAVTPS
jgi:toxin-antitoxin system PIN domain toxin